MSSSGIFKIGELELTSSRNCVNPALIWIFRSDDQLIQWIDNRDRDLLARYVDDRYLDEFDEHNPYKLLKYECPVAVAKDRLDLKGFTYETARLVFESQLESEIERFESYRCDYPSTVWDQALEELRSLTVETWVCGIKWMLNDSLMTIDWTDVVSDDTERLVLRKIQREAPQLYGFPGGHDFGGNNVLHAFRIIAEHSPKDRRVIYDLTDLEAGGWIDEVDDLVSSTDGLLYAESWLIEPVIVLTEGETDRRIIKQSLALLYPHLADYFRFFQHSATGSGGGVGRLVNLVRAFAALDVRQRVVALFDNDTAARESLSTLDCAALPSNISVIHYPDCETAKDYPTLGPTGGSNMNVNGLAAGIELYLGKDVLADDTGKLSPVQWRGYSPKVGAYQGELLDKRGVLEKFDEKLALCQNSPERIEDIYWEDIRAILDALRGAFHEVDRQSMIQSEIESVA